LIQIKGKIKRKSKVWGQLKAKLKKFTVKDHFAIGVKPWKFSWLKLGVKLKKIKSLMAN